MTATNILVGTAAQRTADAAQVGLSLWSGWIQLGFAGFCLVLVLLVIWLVRGILSDKREERNVLLQLNGAIATNTEVTRSLSASVQTLTAVLLRRPRLHALEAEPTAPSPARGASSA